MKCYVLIGATGEYSDHVTWVVRVYQDKRSANAAQILAHTEGQRYASRYKKINGNQTYEHQREAEFRLRAELLTVDRKSFQMDYNGTHYSVIETDMLP